MIYICFENSEIFSVEIGGFFGVTYGNVHVNLGNELTPTQVKFEPQAQWETENGAFYTLSLVGPDAPNPVDPTLGEMLHWLVINIPGVSSKDEPLDVKRGDVIAEYVGAAPPNGTGCHRYLFLAHKQSTKFKLDVMKLPTTYIRARDSYSRLRFKITQFAKNYNLSEPIAGNFYISRFDDWVTEIEKKFQEVSEEE